MSGYLQRLVNTASERAEAVHPRTGSIFSPPRDDLSSLPQRIADTETEMTAQPASERQAPSPRVTRAETPERVTRESAYAPLFPAADEPSPAVPHTPAVLRAVLTGGVEQVAARAAQKGEMPRHSDDAAMELRLAPRPARSADAPVRRSAIASQYGETATRRVEPRRVSRDRHADPTPRQTDDIQIHIGRIEVVAVPAPAPRPLKAPDRSLSLDDYLSRRDRRPR